MNNALRSTRGIALAVMLTVAFASSMASTVMAQAVTVIVQGQQLNLNPGPIEKTGRVFVPLRAIFEALGASVVYQAGTINATKGRTTVSLQIGSTQVSVNGQAQYIDVAPFIVGATTYVPLRFVAQSLGANVNYNDSTRVITISAGHAPPPVHPVHPYPPVRPIPPPNPPPAPSPIHLVAPQPEPSTRITNRFATISAQFSRTVQSGSIRVWLDGSNITNQCGISEGSFSYKPPAPLDFGSHTVRVAGNGAGGLGFDRSWSFTVLRSGPPPSMHLTITNPSPDGSVGSNFTVRGNTVPNARIRVTAGATPSVTGQFSGTTTAGPRGNFAISVSLNTLMGQQSVKVRITATDPNTSQTTETTLQLRLNQ